MNYTCVDPPWETADFFFIYIYFFWPPGKRGCFGRPWDVIGLASDGGQRGQKAKRKGEAARRKGMKRRGKKKISGGEREKRREDEELVDFSQGDLAGGDHLQVQLSWFFFLCIFALHTRYISYLVIPILLVGLYYFDVYWFMRRGDIEHDSCLWITGWDEEKKTGTVSVDLQRAHPWPLKEWASPLLWALQANPMALNPNLSTSPHTDNRGNHIHHG